MLRRLLRRLLWCVLWCVLWYVHLYTLQSRYGARCGEVVYDVVSGVLRVALFAVVCDVSACSVCLCLFVCVLEHSIPQPARKLILPT